MSRRPSRTHTSWLLAVVLAALAVTFNPTAGGDRLRAMLGIGQDLTVTLTSADSIAAGYELARSQPHGSGPVTWDPCHDIPYVVNPEGAPAGYDAALDDAVAEIERASGLRFRYDGTTDDRTFVGRSGPSGPAPPVLVAWATPAEVPELAGDVVGIGRAEAWPVAADLLAYVTGIVALDRDAFTALGTAPDGVELQRAVIEHELAHVLGLSHVDDPAQLMYSETTIQRHLAPGDLAGLAVVGGGPCL